MLPESLYQRGLCILARHGFLHFPFPEDEPSPPDLTALDPAPRRRATLPTPFVCPAPTWKGASPSRHLRDAWGPRAQGLPTVRDPATASPGSPARAWGQGQWNRGSAPTLSPHAPGLSETFPPLITPPLKEQNVQHYDRFTDEEAQTWSLGFPLCLGPQDLMTSPPSCGPMVSLYPSPGWAP